jgi:GNAT superfamily N-acetyltransferase
MPVLAVRPALPPDEPFLYEVYHALRAPEFALVALPEAHKQQLIRMQFQAQLGSYAAMYPNSCYHLVLLDDQPIGKLWVARLESEFHLVDIAMLPKYRKLGIGTALIERLQQEAAQAGLPIRSSVFRFNLGSFRFHQRLGFGVLREDLINFYMEWKPGNS